MQRQAITRISPVTEVLRLYRSDDSFPNEQRKEY